MKLIIEGELTDLNTYVNKERANRFAAAVIKQKETNRVYWECKAQKIQPIKFPVFVECHWFCKNKRKDKDNTSFGKKFLMDGMVKAGVLEDDRWDNILGFRDVFFIDAKNPHIEVYMYGKEVLEKAEERQISVGIGRGS